MAAFAATDRVRAMAARAAEVFWRTEGPGGLPRRRSAGSEACFAEWFLLDYTAPAPSGTLLGAFADGTAGLDARETSVLFALMRAPMRPFEVTETPGPAGAVMKDLLAGAESPVGPFGLPDGLIRSDICVGRVFTIGRFRRVGLGLLRFPAAGRGELLAYLRAAYGLSRPGRHVSLEDYADGAAYLYHHFFLEQGRALDARPHRTCRWAPFQALRVRYQGLDRARIRAALDRQSALQRIGESQGACRFRWVDTGHGVALGSVVLRGDELEVCADTAEDVTRLCKHVESSLRGLVRRLESNAEWSPPATWQTALETETGAAGGAFLRRILAAWPDTPSPALSGQTPRAACRLPAGRGEVTRLLADLDRSMARHKRLGKAWAETSALWEALCLSPPSPTHGAGANDAPSLSVRERARTARR